MSNITAPKSLRQRFGAQVGKFNNHYDTADGDRWTLMFDRAIENRVNLHLTPDGPSVASMLHDERGWSTNDGQTFARMHDAAEHLIKIRSEPRGAISGGDAGEMQGHPKIVGLDLADVETRAVIGAADDSSVIHAKPNPDELAERLEIKLAKTPEEATALAAEKKTFGCVLDTGRIVLVEYSTGSDQAIIRMEEEDKIAFVRTFNRDTKIEQIVEPPTHMLLNPQTYDAYKDAVRPQRRGMIGGLGLRGMAAGLLGMAASAPARPALPLHGPRAKAKQRVIRKRHIKRSTYSPRKASKTGQYKGSKMAKRATRLGGNHAKSKFAGEPTGWSL